jgi:hypothetical protein
MQLSGEPVYEKYQHLRIGAPESGPAVAHPKAGESVTRNKKRKRGRGVKAAEATPKGHPSAVKRYVRVGLHEPRLTRQAGWSELDPSEVDVRPPRPSPYRNTHSRPPSTTYVLRPCGTDQ